MTLTQAAALAAYSTDADLRAAKIRMGEALPDRGWLHDYLVAVTPLTDAPVEFHVASGLSALAAAAGNRFHVESWGQNVFPHLWVVLVAPSSFWRKSTAIGSAESILRDAVPLASYPSDFSREKFLSILVDRPAGLLTLKEFGGFLASLGRDYMGGTKENLTELYDGPDVFTRSLKAGEITVRRPAITILAATTLDWLESRIDEGDLRGGFLARFLFVTAKEKASIKGLTGGMDIMARNQLVRDLAWLSEREPALVGYEPGVREIVNDWMNGWEAEVGRTHHRNDLSGFAVRLQTYALKLAMLYRLSACAADESLDAALLDETCVRQAIAYCRVLWANVAGLLDDEIAVTKEAKELRRVKGIIGAGITRSSALQLSHMKARDFDQYLDTLVQGGEVTNLKRKASEVGLERARDGQVQWLAPRSSSQNGALHGVSLGLALNGSEPQDLLTGENSSLSELAVNNSLSLSPNDDSKNHMRARANANARPDDVDEQADAVGDDERPERFL